MFRVLGIYNFGFLTKETMQSLFFQSLKRYIYTRFDAFNIVPLHVHLYWSRILKWIPFRTNKIQFLLNERTNKSEKTFCPQFEKMGPLCNVYGVILEGTANMLRFYYCQDQVVIWLLAYIRSVLIHSEFQKFTI